MYLAACFALYLVAVMLYTFRVAGTTEFALNRGNLLCFFGTCCLALVIVLMYHLFLAAWFVHATVVGVTLAAASRAGLVLLSALWFLTLGINDGTDLWRGSFIAVIRKSRTCC
ncbi:MAG: hypothetical protein D3903_14330 [Candidatus Electrothrix sp. GM3_4]|nr:hypothetical protein [Candidatus Electrothrix sp. GM3_4]